MATEITITTKHDTPLFDPEDHHKAAAEQLGVDPATIQCTAGGPDEFAEVSPALYSQDGTLLKPRVVSYTRNTTWALKPTVKRVADPERKPDPPPTQQAPKLARGARWHGTIGGVEGMYVSDGANLVLEASAQGQATIRALTSERVVHQTATEG